MRAILFGLAVIALSILPPTAARAACYTPDVAEAEQGIRIHSELMVIGLNCQHMTAAGRKNLYVQYRDFTNRHADLFSGYERTLIRHFKGEGKRNPEGELHTLRTGFANKVSKDAAQMRPDLFCRRYATRIAQASLMDRNAVRQWAATPFASHPVSRPMCDRLARR